MSDNGRGARQALAALEYRCIGPYRGGRVVAVHGHPTESNTFYFGSTGGGVWQTTDAGRFWHNISDGYFQRASVGAIAIPDSDPNVIYVGMGESTIRGNVSHGDGVYRSTDGGKTWTHCGLAATRNIGRVRVHPRNPDLVYVAALGHAHGPNPERGVYRSKDGGQTWEQVLSRGEDAGAVDLCLDPNNPRIIYATFWEARRGPHYLNSGGPGSGLFKSTDGGDTWTEISHNKGLPKGVLGKVGVAVSAARPDRVWAIVEAEDGAVFRSDDAGATWTKLCEDRNLRQRAWYYHHIYADPADPETVYVLNVEFWKSTDGGKTFFTVPIPHGDHHDLWIDPRNPCRMINGHDGGANVTFNGGESWSDIYNQPTSEFYHVTTDNDLPYRVYGAQQDNTTITVPSRAPIAGITREYAYAIGGGESGYIAVDPRDPNIVYAGSYQGFLTRYDHRTGQQQNIMVWPEMSMGEGAEGCKYRFQWTYPIHLSPHDPDTLYVCGNHVFRSRDRGHSFEPISPDLTRHDPSRLGPSGGPITKDNTGAEYYCTVFAFAESPVERGVLWAGTDDGLIHVSRDHGATWQNVTPDLPEWALISIVESSPHAAGTAYVAATRYKLDDFKPYLLKTTNYGQSWTRIDAGLPEDSFTRVIREDPARQGLLYCGTETGVWISFDDGAAWEPLQLNLPVVPIHDLVVKDSDLVLGTHGRSFWILDDLTPLRQLTDEIRQGAAHLFAPRPTIRFTTNKGFGHPPNPAKNYRMTGATIVTWTPVEAPTGETVEKALDAGQNPPDGVIVTYWLGAEPSGEVTLTFLDENGQEIKRFTSRRPEEKADGAVAARTTEATPSTGPGGAAEPEPGEGAEGIVEATRSTPVGDKDKKGPWATKQAGFNRFVWDTRYPDAKAVDNDQSMAMLRAGTTGPLAAPGRYTVRLEVDGQTYEQSFRLHHDPRVGSSEADLKEQFELAMAINQKLSATHEAINRLRGVRTQLEPWAKRDGEVGTAASALIDRMSEIEGELIQAKAKSRQDTLNYPIKLNAKLAGLAVVVAGSDHRPTASSRAVFDDLCGRIDAQIVRLDAALGEELAALNRRIRESDQPVIQAP